MKKEEFKEMEESVMLRIKNWGYYNCSQKALRELECYIKRIFDYHREQKEK